MFTPTPRWVWRLAVASLAVASVAWAARTAYVNTRYASLRAGKTSTSPIVEKLQLGQPVEVLAEAGAFLQVKVQSGKTGFVAKAWTGDKPPATSGIATSLGQAARSSSSGGVSYTAGARGLSTEAETYAAGLGLQDAADAVKRMEKANVDDAAVDAFLQTGKLGDYRAVSGEVKP